MADQMTTMPGFTGPVTAGWQPTGTPPQPNINLYPGTPGGPPLPGQQPATPAKPAANGAPSYDPNSIVSSMVLPAYSNFSQMMQQAQGQMNPNNPQGLFQTGAAAISSTNQASQSAITSQVASGMAQLETQAGDIRTQQASTLDALTAEEAAASGNTTANTAFYDQKQSINNKFNSALAQINQAKTLLQLQGTADQQAANQKAASDLYNLAINNINSTMQLAGQALTASTQVAQTQYQASTYGLSVDQYNFAKQQYQDQRNDLNQQWAQQNDIKTPYYVVGGTVYNTATHQGYSDPKQAQAAGVDTANWSNVTSVTDQTVKQLVTNMIAGNPGAGILPTDSIQTAENKWKSSAMYQASLASGIASANKPIGVLQQVQQLTGLNNTQFNYANKLIQDYLNQHPTAWNMNNVDQGTRDQMKNEMVNTFQNLAQTANNPLTGMPYKAIQQLVDYYFFTGDNTEFVQQLKIDTSKPTASDAFSQILGGGGLQGGAGSGAPSQTDTAISNALK